MHQALPCMFFFLFVFFEAETSQEKILIPIYQRKMKLRCLMYVDMSISVTGLSEFADKRLVGEAVGSC